MGVSLYTIDYSSLTEHFEIPGISSMSNTEKNERKEEWALIEYGKYLWITLTLFNHNKYILSDSTGKELVKEGKLSNYNKLGDFFNEIKEEIFFYFYENDITFKDIIFEKYFKVKKREIILNKVKNM